jgi:hypothetical protein
MRKTSKILCPLPKPLSPGGARGEYVQTPEQLRDALKRSYQAAVKENLSTVINVQAIKEFTSAKHYPPGVALNPEPGVGAFSH